MKLQKKKVLVLASTFPRWKNDTTPPFVFELEKRLAKDFQIHVLAPHHKGAKKYEELEGLKIHRFQYFWPSFSQKLCYEGGILPNIKKNKLLLFQGVTLILSELINAIKIIAREKIDFIHAHWLIPQGIVAYLIYKIQKTPYIITIHGSDIFGLKSSLLIKIKKGILLNAAHITVVSNSLKEEIEKNISKDLRISVISMGVDSNLFHPKKVNKSLKEKYKINAQFILFIGRLAENKGVQYLISAMPQIIKRFNEAKLMIIGEGSFKVTLEKLASKLNLNTSLIFAGAVPNESLPCYYATADVFVSPSIKTKDGQEGFGLTIVEASLSGCIPIGTRLGGIMDIITEGENGYLVSEKKSDEIASQVIKIFNDQKTLQIVKRNARTNALQKYDWKIISDKYLGIYRNS